MIFQKLNNIFTPEIWLIINFLCSILQNKYEETEKGCTRVLRGSGLESVRIYKLWIINLGHTKNTKFHDKSFEN